MYKKRIRRIIKCQTLRIRQIIKTRIFKNHIANFTEMIRDKIYGNIKEIKLNDIEEINQSIIQTIKNN